MLFAVSPGSDGDGPERLVASLPFVIAPGAALITPEKITHTLGGSNVKLEKLQQLHSLTLGPFATEAEAARGLGKLESALLWSSLVLGIGIQYAHVRGAVTLLEEPQPIPDAEPMAYIGRATSWNAVDGHYEAEQAVVRPDHKRLVRWEVGGATVTVQIGGERFLACLEEALMLPDLEGVAANAKLKLAIELYAAHRFELSEKAQFISLVTVLEALLPDVTIEPSAAPALEQALDAVRSARDRKERDSAEWVEIGRLLSRISKLKHEAIGTSMRRFTESIVRRHRELGDPEAVSDSLREAYSVRSRLLHDGESEEGAVRAQLRFLRTFVPKLLRVLFEEASGVRR